MHHAYMHCMCAGIWIACTYACGSLYSCVTASVPQHLTLHLQTIHQYSNSNTVDHCTCDCIHICMQASAVDEFKQCKLAYETLTDEARRREYDQTARVRRLNFFQDIDEDELQQGWGRAVDPWEVHR